MLVSFSVSNFRSFDEEQTLSLVASKRHSAEHTKHTLPIPGSDERVLRTAVLYGANGAGKSNLFKALHFLKKIAIRTRSREEPLDRERFLLRPDGLLSTFDVQFIWSDKLFRYSVKVNDFAVVEESFVRIHNAREIVVYERSTTSEGKVQVVLGKVDAGDEDWAKIEALASIGGPQNQSFLATVFVTLDEWPALFMAPVGWFISQLRLVDPSDDPDPGFESLFATDPELLRFAGSFLNAASTGIDHLAATEEDISEEDASRLLSPRVRKRLAGAGESSPQRYVLENGDVLTATRSGEEISYTLIQLKAAHRGFDGQDVSFEIRQESDGTRRLLELIPALHTMHRRTRCYFIDEIDRSLHPMLVYDFLRFFLDSCEGKEAQLIVTTHETSLLDQDLLRRDEIWFAEKSRQGATALYSLLEFKPRNDMQLHKNYLQGRFGAVPFLGGIERLLENERKPD